VSSMHEYDQRSRGTGDFLWEKETASTLCRSTNGTDCGARDGIIRWWHPDMEKSREQELDEKRY